MACMSTLNPGQTLAQRMAEAEQALKQLEALLQSGKVKVGIAPNGAIVFLGWLDQDRKKISDVCAYRSLLVGRSVALRRAVEQAQRMTGRTVNAQAIAAGYHSHDGGKTFSRH